MKIVLRKSDAKEPFTFVFLDDEGKTLIKSENYTQKASAKNGIESVRKNCLEDKRYEFKEAKSGKLFFNIKSTNGQVVGTSGFFDDKAKQDKAVAYLKANAKKAKIEEA
ncbi:MAG: hypothetical protein CR967_01860 [Proteobacteria bacterium]|nr:MAG: hypothetical protein CR967_01860 [Pseudomonadota bacterium]